MTLTYDPAATAQLLQWFATATVLFLGTWLLVDLFKDG